MFLGYSSKYNNSSVILFKIIRLESTGRLSKQRSYFKTLKDIT